MARTHIYARVYMCMHTYTLQIHIPEPHLRNVKAPLDARETEIYQQAVIWRGGGGLIPCNGNEMNAMEHEGRHEAKFPAEGRINQTLLLGNTANHTARMTIFSTESKRELHSRDWLYSEKDYAQRHLRIACVECIHVRFGH